MSKAKMTRRIENYRLISQSLPVLKAWAIVWIVAYHLLGNTKGYLTLNEAIAPLTGGGLKNAIDAVLALFISAGATGVNVFLIVSGFGLTASWWKQYGSQGIESVPLTEFWKKRVFRIFPPFWVAVAIATLLYFIHPDWAPFGQNIWQQESLSPIVALLSTLTTLRNFTTDYYYFLNGAWWYVGLSLQLYLIFPWLIRLGCRWGWSKLVLVSFLFSLSYRAVFFLSPAAGLGMLVPLAFFPSRLFEFAFGIYVAMTFLSSKQDSRRMNKSQRWLQALLLKPQFIPLNFGLFAIGFICKSLPYPLLNIFSEAAIGVGLFCGLVNLAQLNWLKLKQIFSIFGKHSYGIYLIHMNVYLMLWPLGIAWVPSYWPRFVLVLLATCLIGIGFDAGFTVCSRAFSARWFNRKAV